MHVARKRVFVGTHAKFGTSTPHPYAEVRDFDAVVTDTDLPDPIALQYQTSGVRLIRA